MCTSSLPLTPPPKKQWKDLSVELTVIGNMRGCYRLNCVLPKDVLKSQPLEPVNVNLWK